MAAPIAPDGPAAESDRPDPIYRPRWYRLAWFLGRPPPLSPRQWSVLGLVAVVSLFEQYDLYLFALSLKHIQADLGIPEGELGWTAAVVRAGALPALFVTIAADRFGRRRLLLLTVVAYTLLTAATAFSPNVEYFVAVQFLARTFAIAETLIAVVVIAEEFAPRHRGWGIGALGAIQGCGAGLAALMFGFVDVLPYGWRALYLVGIAPLLLIAHWRRRLPETRRFVDLREARGAAMRSTPALAPVVALVRDHPGRAGALGSVVLVFGLASGAAAFFAPKYLQDVHGWTPAAVAALNFLGGALAIVANPLAGRLSDDHGRRPVTAAFALAFGLVVILFYAGAGLVVAPLWILLIFSMMGTQVTLAAYGAEMFATSQRSTAAGLRSAATEVGAVAGLALVSVLFAVLGSNRAAIGMLGAVALLAPLLVWMLFPETAGRSLEEIAPESPAAAPPADPSAGP